MVAAGDSIPGAEEENPEEFDSISTTSPRTLRRKSLVDRSISLSPPPSSTWSLVSIKDNHHEGDDDDSSSLIFPPTKHENLHLSPPSPPPPLRSLDFKHRGESFPLQFLSSSSSSSEIVEGDESSEDSSTSTLFSPSSGGLESPPVLRERKIMSLAGWVNIGVEVLYSGIKGLLQGWYRRLGFKWAAMVVGFLYFWWRRRRGRIERESRQHRMVRIIKEKDERISQLLNQIAQMNALLLAFQRLPSSSEDLK